MSTARLRVESQEGTVVVATARPRLTWSVQDEAARDWVQTCAEIELDGATTTIVDGRDSVLVSWPFGDLEAHARHTVRVRVAGDDGVLGRWSRAVEIVSGFLDPGEWQASLVEMPDPARTAQPFRARYEFTSRAAVVRATLFATAHGVYQARLNGRAVDDQEMKPGWTPYHLRLVHESTDVTELVAPGRNVLALDVAGAWFTERYGFRAESVPHYGEQPAVAAQLRLEYADGLVELVTTGEHWRLSADGPLLESGLYDGEAYDARREQPGWDRPGYDDREWVPAAVRPHGVEPGPRTSPVARGLQTVPVAKVIDSASGGRILDFGQNLVGRLRIRLEAPEGTTLTLRHAEVLEHGELGTRPLRLAKATDTYVCRGGGEEVWEPLFTFHGFRYAEITSTGTTFDPVAAHAVVIHSDMRRIGHFHSSERLLNQLHENVVWGMRGNFLYLPTDCPQRDERLGWTGDIQVFAPTACFLYDCDSFLASWLTDLALEQHEAGGVVPFVVPNVLHDAATPAAAWGDAATVVPSVLFERFGDREVLAAQFGSMQAWTDRLLKLAGSGKLWNTGFQFGDWLDPTAPPEDASRAATSPDIVATAYLVRSADLTASVADVLGDAVAAEHYRRRAEEVRMAFVEEYVAEDGTMVSDAQTAYALAIVFGIVRSPRLRQRMGDRLAELVRASGHHIGTGFVGTPLVADALTDTGHLDDAESLLLQTSKPSWLYPVTMGATTIWERWDSMLEDGTINPGEMTSFNHYALGAVADWLHRVVAGLGPAEPGYRTLRIAPRPLERLDWAEASLDTPYGLARVAWRRETDRIVVEAVVPPNTTAVVELPGSSETLTVGSGEHIWEASAGLSPARSAPSSRP